MGLGYAAAVTDTLRLIPNIVVLPYRNPFVVAKAAATLDMLSGGRFTLAVGAGYLKGEFAALGVDHAERNELVDEGLGVIRAIWTGDDVTVEGRHFSARGITAHPRPITQPHPPIWIGGNSGRARQRVADHGDGWCPFPAPAIVATTARTASLDTTELLAEAIDDLRRRLDAAGRDPATVDIAFSNPAGGDPASDAFDADAHLEGLAELARLGVSWVQVGLPGDSVEHAVEVAQRYGEQVIAGRAPVSRSSILLVGRAPRVPGSRRRPSAGGAAGSSARCTSTPTTSTPGSRGATSSRGEPESLTQNLVIADAVAAAADRFATGGYDVVVDGVLGLWSLDPWRALGRPISYALLLPDATVARQRAADRGEHPLKDLDVVDQMHAAFVAHLDGYEHHVIDSTDAATARTAATGSRRDVRPPRSRRPVEASLPSRLSSSWCTDSRCDPAWRACRPAQPMRVRRTAAV